MKRIAIPNPSPFQSQTIWEGSWQSECTAFAGWSVYFLFGISFNHIGYFFNIAETRIFYLNFVHNPVIKILSREMLIRGISTPFCVRNCGPPPHIYIYIYIVFVFLNCYIHHISIIYRQVLTFYIYGQQY